VIKSPHAQHGFESPTGSDRITCSAEVDFEGVGLAV
jgi:hypothetical protein